MSVPLAYLGIVLIWSTTPLAIKWSGEEVGFLFGITGRMLVGLSVASLLMWLWRRRLPWDKAAWQVYLAVGLPLYGSMLSVYWGAQYVNSGLISVLFGLTPLFTALFARVLLGERSFTFLKLVGMGLGFVGLAWIFDHQVTLGPQAQWGIMAVLLASLIHSLGTVWAKRAGTRLHPMTMNTGGLMLAAPLFLLTWLLSGATWPQRIPGHAAGSIVYLGVVGSVLGAALFYYALQHLSTGSMALLTLITPVTALWLGRWLNGETLDPDVLLGTACILLGLVCYHWRDLLRQRRHSSPGHYVLTYPSSRRVDDAEEGQPMPTQSHTEESRSSQHQRGQHQRGQSN